MSLHAGKWLRTLALIGCGAITGAAAALAVCARLHTPLRPKPALKEPPALGVEAPVEFFPTELPEFFGFGVGSQERAAEASHGTASPAVPAARPSLPSPNLVRLRLMEDRCVVGFDGTSSLYDFTGWSKSVTGAGTYEAGKLAETAKAWVSADARTFDTGDAERDEEIRLDHLETDRFPEMRFELSSLRMTGAQSAIATGTLDIHGVRRSVTVSCEIWLRRDGYAHLKGDVHIRMSDFGIRRPSKLGVVKVADEVRVWFEIWAEPVKEKKS